ncbi:hypothetical protein B0T21DRAFT_175416 [Apiosordaria backusii]|uniref:Uncharacterized protein n=1 Tax=Apiosordaria backusii TaxID=314023 RepID=A0AA40BL20_9PEZI|nr:hypothetical protein B0T21DRAFT_175416 [Apiosordaria backusii]
MHLHRCCSWLLTAPDWLWAKKAHDAREGGAVWQPKHAPAGTLMQALKHSRLFPLCLSCLVWSVGVFPVLVMLWPTWDPVAFGSVSCSGLDPVLFLSCFFKREARRRPEESQCQIYRSRPRLPRLGNVKVSRRLLSVLRQAMVGCLDHLAVTEALGQFTALNS